jgi:hypothetical protein
MFKAETGSNKTYNNSNLIKVKKVDQHKDELMLIMSSYLGRQVGRDEAIRSLAELQKKINPPA